MVSITSRAPYQPSHSQRTSGAEDLSPHPWKFALRLALGVVDKTPVYAADTSCTQLYAPPGSHHPGRGGVMPLNGQSMCTCNAAQTPRGWEGGRGAQGPKATCAVFQTQLRISRRRPGPGHKAELRDGATAGAAVTFRPLTKARTLILCVPRCPSPRHFATTK